MHLPSRRPRRQPTIVRQMLGITAAKLSSRESHHLEGKSPSCGFCSCQTKCQHHPFPMKHKHYFSQQKYEHGRLPIKVQGQQVSRTFINRPDRSSVLRDVQEIQNYLSKPFRSKIIKTSRNRSSGGSLPKVDSTIQEEFPHRAQFQDNQDYCLQEVPQQYDNQTEQVNPRPEKESRRSMPSHSLRKSAIMQKQVKKTSLFHRIKKKTVRIVELEEDSRDIFASLKEETHRYLSRQTRNPPASTTESQQKNIEEVIHLLGESDNSSNIEFQQLAQAFDYCWQMLKENSEFVDKILQVQQEQEVNEQMLVAIRLLEQLKARLDQPQKDQFFSRIKMKEYLLQHKVNSKLLDLVKLIITENSRGNKLALREPVQKLLSAASHNLTSISKKTEEINQLYQTLQKQLTGREMSRFDSEMHHLASEVRNKKRKNTLSGILRDKEHLKQHSNKKQTNRKTANNSTYSILMPELFTFMRQVQSSDKSNSMLLSTVSKKSKMQQVEPVVSQDFKKDSQGRLRPSKFISKLYRLLKLPVPDHPTFGFRELKSLVKKHLESDQQLYESFKNHLEDLERAKREVQEKEGRQYAKVSSKDLDRLLREASQQLKEDLFHPLLHVELEEDTGRVVQETTRSLFHQVRPHSQKRSSGYKLTNPVKPADNMVMRKMEDRCRITFIV